MNTIYLRVCFQHVFSTCLFDLLYTDIDRSHTQFLCVCFQHAFSNGSFDLFYTCIDHSHTQFLRVSQYASSNFSNVFLHSRIGYICMAFLHCVPSYVSSDYLHDGMRDHTDYIWKVLLLALSLFNYMFIQICSMWRSKLTQVKFLQFVIIVDCSRRCG